nr:tRNA-uridine aminocarboxypropyltransferase [Pusillimonas noertemannii]
MPEAPNPTRPRCQRCQRPLSHCLCAHVTAVCNHTRVLILQHPDEARHPLNTARLAVLGLEHAQLLIGECFPQLDDIVASAGRALLLFPDKAGCELKAGAIKPGQSDGPEAITLSLNEPAHLGALSESGPALLIVPDGTWRKARRIVRMNPVLAALPRLSLPAGAPSEYRVRKASEPAAVATIEAIVRSLSLLEPARDFQPLLAPFRALVQQQLNAMGQPEASE